LAGAQGPPIFQSMRGGFGGSRIRPRSPRLLDKSGWSGRRRRRPASSLRSSHGKPEISQGPDQVVLKQGLCCTLPRALRDQYDSSMWRRQGIAPAQESRPDKRQRGAALFGRAQ